MLAIFSLFCLSILFLLSVAQKCFCCYSLVLVWITDYDLFLGWKEEIFCQIDRSTEMQNFFLGSCSKTLFTCISSSSSLIFLYQFSSRWLGITQHIFEVVNCWDDLLHLTKLKNWRCFIKNWPWILLPTVIIGNHLCVLELYIWSYLVASLGNLKFYMIIIVEKIFKICVVCFCEWILF